MDSPVSAASTNPTSQKRARTEGLGYTRPLYNSEALKPYLEVIGKCCSDEIVMKPEIACLASDDVRKAFDHITGAAGRQTWQNYGKLTVHLPQLESLVSMIIKRFQPGKDTLLFELGAGKGLLGRIVAEMTGCRHLALDCRDITSGYDGQEEGDECSDGYGDEDCEASGGARKTIRVRADVTATDLRSVLEDQCSKMKADGIDKPKVLFIAKHLCGNGSDAAVKSIASLLAPTAGGGLWTVRGAVLAPCCHPQAKLEAFAGLEEDLAKLDADEERSGKEWRAQVWEILMELLYMSKLGGALRPSDCSSWSAMSSAFTFSQLRRLGRKCRVLLESMRARELVSEGATGEVELVQYASQNVTPDNLAIVYDSNGKFDMQWDSEFPGAVVIRVLMDQSSKKTVTLPKRLSEYILGMKSLSLEWQGVVKSAYPICISDLECGSSSGCVQMESAALVIIHRKEDVVVWAPLMSLLIHDPLVKRVVSMLYPIHYLGRDTVESTLAQLGPDELPVRTCAAPHALELNKDICSDENCGHDGVVCNRLSPTKFVSVYSGVQFIDKVDPWPVDTEPTCCTFGWSVVPRAEWDPSLLRKTQTPKYTARMYELTRRFGVQVASGTRVHIICDKKKDKTDLEEAIVALGGSMTDSQEDANLLMVELPSQRHDAILRRTSEALKYGDEDWEKIQTAAFANSLAKTPLNTLADAHSPGTTLESAVEEACEDGTAVVARLNVNGIRGRTLKKQDKDLRKLTVAAVRNTCVDIRINHLVTDKELERMTIMTYSSI
ncbi:hypothetical protein FOL47_002633 [Perkinsus chesapeaki]|uniref:tRNA:m(4)X modification enzyme TRM13 n=1 Tax=Perkinsus chesapeaki TaxID=330153 RepID=A0A7J6MCK0_PERCH|nr:hypothetical protein FOL47_002633 [Perkinsus chesapeaki]